jgi:hypothetical protein
MAFFFWCLQCFFSPQCVQFDLVSKYYITFIGLPVSAMGAGVLVTLLRITDGPVKLKLFVFEFEGASGQIIMYVVVFLSFVLALYMLRNS